MADITVGALIDSVVEMPGEFADVATHDPLNPVLMLFGVLFVAAPVLAMGYLSLGALFSLFAVESSAPPSRQER